MSLREERGFENWSGGHLIGCEKKISIRCMFREYFLIVRSNNKKLMVKVKRSLLRTVHFVNMNKKNKLFMTLWTFDQSLGSHRDFEEMSSVNIFTLKKNVRICDIEKIFSNVCVPLFKKDKASVFYVQRMVLKTTWNKLI